MQTKQAKSFLLWFVIFATTISLCGFSNIGQDTPHVDESAPAAASCMLGSCGETLTSKKLATPDIFASFLSLFSLALLPLFFRYRHPETAAHAAFFRDPHARKRTRRGLYQLHAIFLI